MPRRKPANEGPQGLLLVDKPAGLSSAAVVARVRRVLGGVKAGHTGTLDPFATGLLPLCLGEGTKLAASLTDADKGYEGVIRLGVRTDTLDRTGEVLEEGPAPEVDAAGLAALAARMTGPGLQVPPAFSAIKRDGVPMYRLARRGEAPELEARPVRVERLELLPLGPGRVGVSIDCSKGFYVRSLARDLGDALGCGAILEDLRRTRVGHLSVDDAVPLEALEGEEGADAALQALVPLDQAVGHLRRLEISARDASDLRQGRQGVLGRLGAGARGERAALVAGRDLVAVAVADGPVWTLERVFVGRALSDPCPRSEIV